MSAVPRGNSASRCIDAIGGFGNGEMAEIVLDRISMFAKPADRIPSLSIHERLISV